VSGLFGDERRLAAMASASASLAMPDAARRIADAVLEAATRPTMGRNVHPEATNRPIDGEEQ